MTPSLGTPSGGEPIDRAAQDAIKLAHQALERFPEMVRRHKFIAGGAAISSSLIVLAGVAIAKRLARGETPEEAVAGVTEQEVQGVFPPEPEPVNETEAAIDAEEASANGELEGDTPANEIPAPVNDEAGVLNGASASIRRVNGA